MYNVYGAMFSTSTRHFGSSSLLYYLTGKCDTVSEYRGGKVEPLTLIQS